MLASAGISMAGSLISNAIQAQQAKKAEQEAHLEYMNSAGSVGVMKNGGKVNGIAEVEGGEVRFTPTKNGWKIKQKYQGPGHESGGVTINVEPNTKDLIGTAQDKKVYDRIKRNPEAVRKLMQSIANRPVPNRSFQTGGPLEGEDKADLERRHKAAMIARRAGTAADKEKFIANQPEELRGLVKQYMDKYDSLSMGKTSNQEVMDLYRARDAGNNIVPFAQHISGKVGGTAKAMWNSAFKTSYRLGGPLGEQKVQILNDRYGRTPYYQQVPALEDTAVRNLMMGPNINPGLVLNSGIDQSGMSLQEAQNRIDPYANIGIPVGPMKLKAKSVSHPMTTGEAMSRIDPDRAKGMQMREDNTPLKTNQTPKVFLENPADYDPIAYAPMSEDNKPLNATIRTANRTGTLPRSFGAPMSYKDDFGTLQSGVTTQDNAWMNRIPAGGVKKQPSAAAGTSTTPSASATKPTTSSPARPKATAANVSQRTTMPGFVAPGSYATNPQSNISSAGRISAPNSLGVPTKSGAIEALNPGVKSTTDAEAVLGGLGGIKPDWGAFAMNAAPELINIATGIFGKNKNAPATKVNRAALGHMPTRYNIRPILNANASDYRGMQKSMKQMGAGPGMMQAAYAKKLQANNQAWGLKAIKENEQQARIAGMMANFDSQDAGFGEQRAQDNMMTDANLGIGGNFARSGFSGLANKGLGFLNETNRRRTDLAGLAMLSQAYGGASGLSDRKFDPWIMKLLGLN